MEEVKVLDSAIQKAKNKKNLILSPHMIKYICLNALTLIIFVKICMVYLNKKLILEVMKMLMAKYKNMSILMKKQIISLLGLNLRKVY